MSSELRTIATFSDPIEAELVATRLDEEGISAVISGDTTSAAFSGMGYMAGGIDVLVPAAELDRARSILANFAKEIEAKKHPPPHAITAAPPILELQDELMEPELPPDSNERRIERAFRASILGFFLCPPILHLYSLVILLRVAFHPTDLTTNKSAKFYAAFVLDLIGVALALAVGGFVGLSI